MVRNLTLHYIPFLADTDLLPYLTHSRAGSAYDAVWAMSRAWHTLTPTLFSSYNTCSILNVTEWQSITGEALNETLNGTFKWVDGEMSYDPSYFQGISVSRDTGYFCITVNKCITCRSIIRTTQVCTSIMHAHSRQTFTHVIFADSLHNPPAKNTLYTVS